MSSQAINLEPAAKTPRRRGKIGEIMTAVELCAYLTNVYRWTGSTDALAQWRRRGVGPAYHRLGRQVIYHKADVDAWCAASRQAPKAARNTLNHKFNK